MIEGIILHEVIISTLYIYGDGAIFRIAASPFLLNKGYHPTIPGSEADMETVMNNAALNECACGAKFYTVKDIMEMTTWSKTTVLKLFDDPKFPSADFGKNQIIEEHALIEYFSVRHEKKKDRHWK